MEVEPPNSYFRLLVHRVARYYGFDHAVDPIQKTILVISKNANSTLYFLIILFI